MVRREYRVNDPSEGMYAFVEVEEGSYEGLREVGEEKIGRAFG